MTTTLGFDPSYEYNAPQFLDFAEFKEGKVNDENVDDYFNFDHEAGGQPVGIAESFSEDISIYEDTSSKPNTRNNTPKSSQNTLPKKKTPSRRNTPRSCRSTPGSALCSPAHGIGKENDIPEVLEKLAAVKKTGERSDMPQMKPALSNICTDISAWRSRAKELAPASKHTQKARRKSLRNSAGAVRASRTSLEEHKGPSQSPVNKKHKRSNSLQQHRASTKTVPKPEVVQKAHPRARTHSVEHAIPKRSQNAPVQRRGRTASVEHVPLRGRTDSNEKKQPAVRSGSTGQVKQHHRTASSGNRTVKLRSGSAGSLESKSPRNRSISRSKTSLNGSGGTSMLKPMLTVPATPSFMKRKPISAPSNTKTTEQMEIEKIKELRKDLARKRKVAEESYKTTQMSVSYVPKHSEIKPTKPLGFQFSTGDRIKDHPMTTRQEMSSKDFVANLRHQSPTEVHSKGLHPTKPVPFNFIERKRKRDEEQAEKAYQFKSTAEKMIAFSRKTPERFHTRGKKDPSVKLAAGPAPKLTVPKTPNLESRKRYRPPAVKSQAEREEEEAEAIKRYKFHAQPLKEEIMKGPTGVKKVQSKELTKPMEFDLETDRRVYTRHDNNNSQEEKEGYSKIPHAKPVPHHGIPFMPKYDHKTTEPKPFSFDEKDRHRFAMKDEKIHQIVVSEKRMASDFKATPLPDLSPQLPPKKVIPMTQPAPFDLAVDVRGHQKAEDWSHRIEEELRQQRAAASFRARPNVVTHKKPFLPAKSTKPLTDVDGLELNTEKRAGKRAEFESYRHEKEVEMEEQRVAIERMREEEERQEAERIRSAAVHKAQPVRKFRSVDIRPSDRPLTEPKTPRFSTRLKTRVDH